MNYNIKYFSFEIIIPIYNLLTHQSSSKYLIPTYTCIVYMLKLFRIHYKYVFCVHNTSAYTKSNNTQILIEN